jgi:Na+-driven multidrug efflux pump
MSQHSAHARPAGPAATAGGLGLGSDIRRLFSAFAPVGALFIAEAGLILIDLYLLGPISVSAAAAVAISAEIYFCLVAGFGAFVAVAAFDFAYGVGSGSRKIQKTALILGGVHAAAFGLLALLWGRNVSGFLGLLGFEGEFPALSERYMDILAWSGIPFILVILLQRLSVAFERERILYFVGFGGMAVKLAVGSWLLRGTVTDVGYAVDAAAYANLAAALAMLAIITIGLGRPIADVFLGRKVTVHVEDEDVAEGRGTLKRFWQVGLPLGASMFSDYAQASGILLVFAWLSAIESAAAVLCISVAHFFIVLLYALSETGATALSNRIGSGDLAGQRRLRQSAGLLLLGIAATGAVVLFFFGEWLSLAIFNLHHSDPDQMAVIATSAMYLKISCILIVFEAINSYFTLIYKASGRTRIILVERIVSTWGFAFAGVYCAVVFLDADGLAAWLIVSLSGAVGTLVYLINLRLQHRRDSDVIGNPA